MRHSSKDFIKVLIKHIAEPYYFMVKDATLASENPFRFRKNLFKSFQCIIKS